VRASLLLTLSLAATLQCGPAAPELSGSLSDRAAARLARAPAFYAQGAAALAPTA